MAKIYQFPGTIPVQEQIQIPIDMTQALEDFLYVNHSISPDVCHNAACIDYGDNHKCKSQELRPISCRYRMADPPPSQVCYEQYMPTHQEALDLLEKYGILR